MYIYLYSAYIRLSETIIIFFLKIGGGGYCFLHMIDLLVYEGEEHILHSHDTW